MTSFRIELSTLAASEMVMTLAVIVWLLFLDKQKQVTANSGRSDILPREQIYHFSN